MRQSLVMAALALGVAACAPPSANAPDALTEIPPEVAALAHIYTITVAEAGHEDCLIKLDAEDVDPGDSAVRLAWIDPRCYEAFPIVRTLNQWAPNGSNGVQLIDSEHATIVDFRPVADDTGDYFAGPGPDGKTYELRTPSW